MNEAQRYPLTGQQVFWDNAPTPREDLRKVLDAHQLSALLPDEVTNEKALRHALSAFTSELPPPGGHVWMIRGLKHLKQNGYEVKLEEKDETENDANQAFRVKIVNRIVVIENDTYSFSAIPMVQGAKQQRLQELYDKAKATVPGADVGAILTRILKTYRPMVIALRPMGGLYWIPDAHKVAFESFCDDLLAACPGNVVTPMNWEMTPKGLSRVSDSMLKEMQKECQSLLTDILGGTLGHEAMDNRLRRCIELQDEVTHSDEILGEFSSTLNTILDSARQAATHGLLTC